MFHRSARDSALLARVIVYSKYVFQVKSKSSKSSKGEKMKTLALDENLFFGKLLETKKQKLKRLKLESNGKIQKSEPSNVNSEMAWAMSSGAHLKVINLEKPLNSKEKQNSIHTNSSKDKQRAQTTADSKISTLKEESKDKNITNEQPEPSKKKNSLLSTNVIEKLLEYPIQETYKSPEDKWSSDFKIMSLSAMEEKTCLKYPSVTKILSATMTEQAKAVLEMWKMKMIEKLGERGFEIYQAELLSDGKLLHSSIMNKLTGKAFEVPDRIKNAYLSLSKVLENIDQVRAIESHVIHPRLLYRGIVDCIAVFRGILCCIDWKKSDKTKDTIGSTYDAPLQLASYIGALNADLKYPFQIKKGIIVVAYTNGDPAKVHEVSEESLQLYWRLWLQRLQEYHVALNT